MLLVAWRMGFIVCGCFDVGVLVLCDLFGFLVFFFLDFLIFLLWDFWTLFFVVGIVVGCGGGWLLGFACC